MADKLRAKRWAFDAAVKMSSKPYVQRRYSYDPPYKQGFIGGKLTSAKRARYRIMLLRYELVIEQGDIPWPTHSRSTGN